MTGGRFFLLASGLEIHPDSRPEKWVIFLVFWKRQPNGGFFFLFACSHLVLHKRLLCRASSIHGGGVILQPPGLQIMRPAADFFFLENSDVCFLFFLSLFTVAVG